MRLQCFPPTHYVKNGEYPWCALFKSSQNWCIGCLLALYGSTVHPRCMRCGFLDNNYYFFLLSVHASLKTANLNNLIHGVFGSTWGDKFYMGTQNESNLEI